MRFITLFLILFCSVSYSQKRLTGRVISAENDQVLEDVLISDEESNAWTLTNEKGYFSILINNPNSFLLKFKILGKQQIEIGPEDIENFDEILDVRLKDNNLRLDDVTVTAVPKKSKVGSAVVLDDYAVNQRQAFSVSDILQELPGQTIKAPDFTKTKILNLRTAQGTTTNQFGIAYMIDGLQISNDENMQTYRTQDGLLNFLDNPSNGLDLRNIPASNIEKIEVIGGIPDAEYGNLTTGLIKIDRKAGESPYRIRTSLRQGTTQVSLDKGYSLGENAGKLSFSLNYLNANNNPSDQLNQYDRVTGSAIWSVSSANKKIRNTFSFNFHNNLDDITFDKENDSGKREAKFKKDKGIRLSNRLFWKLNTSLIDQFEFNTGFSYAKQHSYQQFFNNTGGKVVPTAMETGLSSGHYTPVAYLMVKQVFGQPINFNSRVSFRKSLGTAKSKHNLSVGANFNYSHNRGRGKGYDPDKAYGDVMFSSGSANGHEGFRPVSYRTMVIPRKNFGLYFQDNSTYTFNNGHDLFANIGLRYDNQNGFSSFSPRINLGYELSERWSVRGGIGFASKAPSLAQIFPGDKYYDYLLGDIRTNTYAYNLIQTYKIAIDKIDLQPSKIWKYELGTNFNANFANFSLTAYYNNTFDGIVSNDRIINFDFPEVNFIYPEDGSAPDYEVENITNKVETYGLPENSQNITDVGIEFFANFKKIEALNTSFSFSGRYVYSKMRSKFETFTKNKEQQSAKNIPIAIFDLKPSKNDNFQLRATATYHLSDLGMLISLTAEQFTRSTDYASTSSIYPIAYLNNKGDRVPITHDNRDNPDLKNFIKTPIESRDKVTQPYHNFHLRITKEFRNDLSLSMYVTNFLNYRPVVKTGSNEYEKNQPISFGAQINYQF